MRYFLIIFILVFLWSCSACNESNYDNERDLSNNDSASELDAESVEKDDSFNGIDDSEVQDMEVDSETSDVDMYCPYAINANYPYFRKDGTIHFCRPCDTPDEYDPQCVKSLWKDLNKEVYDQYKAGTFEDNEYVVECYPWPCEWKVNPRDPESMPGHTHKCDLLLNPWTWTNSFSGYYRESNMENGKILMWFSNYRVKAPLTSHGYQGQRAVVYDIETGKFTVLGKTITPFYMSNHFFINPYISKDGRGFKPIVDVTTYKDSYKYRVIFTDEDTNVSLDVSPAITEKWTIMDVNHLDDESGSTARGNRSLVYARTGEWKWTTLAYGNPEGKAAELSISGDNAMFYHYGTDASWLCDLSKSPKKVTDCKKVGREGELVGFPKFDKDNPNRIAYRPIADGIPGTRFVIMDISKDSWKVEKEFDIPPTETKYLRTQLVEFKSNIMLYREDYQMDASGYQVDGKLCYYRIDKEKSYCSKLIEGRKTDYGQGWSTFEGKYLFWQPAYRVGYILRDMECYCKEEGVCPFED